ncbi:MAG: hypothetical protein HUK12_09250 [Muribaculaceae bacterium]|nr:hypothetical protein [Muribaculaceae bacterium]
MDSREKNTKISFWNSNLTTVMSVTLVLLLLGIMSILGLSAHNVTQEIRSHIGFEVIVKDEASEQQINSLKQMWIQAPYTSSVKYVSREDALAEWEAETGEDLMEVIGVNPLFAEFEVNVKPEYANLDSLNMIAGRVELHPGVDSVKIHQDMVSSINQNIRYLMLILAAVAGALVVISIALINNTVRLAVYSRRFLIHTMTLVGATAGFIRRPFVLRNLAVGLISAFLANFIIIVGLIYGYNQLPYFMQFIDYPGLVLVSLILFAMGALICSLAGWVAANRFIGLDYDQLFMK